MEYNYDKVKNNIDSLLKARESFIVIGLGGELLEAVKFVEKEIERHGLKCRVYTRNRSIAAAGALVAGGVGVASFAAIAVHNLVTFNPDYEIGKDLIDNRLYVTYQE
jgi:imidazoleglycerol phosphate synthase glutamine amidotransferase subunit HisH